MLLGIFGGSFDPVHNAHLALAHACQAQAGLDEVWFVPAAVQPLKHSGPRANGQLRLAMLRLALMGEPAWQICTLELDRGGVSYTVDTLRDIHAQRPDDHLFFLIGGDALADVHHWKEPEEIFRLATPLVVGRAGVLLTDFIALSKLCPVAKPPRLIPMGPLVISSSQIRQRVAAGEPIDRLVPAAVEKYIADQELYR